MRIRYLAITVLVAAVLMGGVGCTTQSLDVGSFNIQKQTSAKENVILKVEGDSGQAFSGTLLVDGKERAISGVTPAVIPIKGCIIVGTLEKNNGEGSISFEIERRSLTLGFGALSQNGSQLEFAYHNGTVKSRQ